MAFEFAQLLENVRDSRFGFDVQGDGDGLSTGARLQAYHRQIQENIGKGLIPELLENPVGCQLELTYRCNSRCIHCYNDSGSERRARAAELSHEQWIDVARQLGEMGIFQVVISGGEPLLLGERLWEIMDVLKAYGVVFLFITNGSLVTPEVVRRMCGGGYRFCWVQVSLDGHTPELHDRLRGHPGGWERATRAVRLFAEAGLPTVVAHTVFRNNIVHFQEMVDLAVSLGAHEMITGPCLSSGRAAILDEARELQLDAAGREHFVDEVARARARLASAGKAARQRPFRLRPSGGVSVSLRIRAIEPSQVLLIRPDGEVKVDCVLPFAAGNVREGSLAEIWRTKVRTIWRNPEVLRYIAQIESEEQVLGEDLPRPHVDASIRVA
jgi:MoaA/NifB/PqqE/SkfB family radical SAM enzyme